MRPRPRSSARPSAPAGFTLLEVLVAIIIVAMTVTVFFQLLSGSIRLEVKSRERTALVTTAAAAFERLMSMDERAEDFPWEGALDETPGQEAGEDDKTEGPLSGYAWSLTLTEIESQDAAEEENVYVLGEELQKLAGRGATTLVSIPSDLYRFDFRVVNERGEPVLGYSLLRDTPKGRYTEEFKDEHVLRPDETSGEAGQ